MASPYDQLDHNVSALPLVKPPPFCFPRIPGDRECDEVVARIRAGDPAEIERVRRIGEVVRPILRRIAREHGRVSPGRGRSASIVLSSARSTARPRERTAVRRRATSRAGPRGSDDPSEPPDADRTSVCTGAAVTPVCEACGRRLPPSGPGSFIIAGGRGERAVRADARFCGSACRQRAYRRRRAER